MNVVFAQTLASSQANDDKRSQLTMTERQTERTKQGVEMLCLCLQKYFEYKKLKLKI